MSDHPIVDLDPDEPPAGSWTNEHPVLTDEEAAYGEILGRTIDADDDTDNGGVT